MTRASRIAASLAYLKALSAVAQSAANMGVEVPILTILWGQARVHGDVKRDDMDGTRNLSPAHWLTISLKGIVYAVSRHDY